MPGIRAMLALKAIPGISSPLATFPFQIFVVSDAGLYQSITEAAG